MSSLLIELLQAKKYIQELEAKNEKALKEIDDLQITNRVQTNQEILKLKSHNEALEIRNRQMEYQLEKSKADFYTYNLCDIIRELKIDFPIIDATHKTDEDCLKIRIGNLVDGFRKLESTLSESRTEHARAIDGNCKYQTEIRELKSELWNCKTKNQNLELENQKLKTENQNWETKNVDLKYKIQMLENKNKSWKIWHDMVEKDRSDWVDKWNKQRQLAEVWKNHAEFARSKYRELAPYSDIGFVIPEELRDL